MTAQAKLSRQHQMAAVAAASMANRDTPLIRNAWYVAARSQEVTRSLFSRQYLGVSTVLFRKQDGAPVALQNRCCHRSFPLSQGKLDGDVLECGYHGFRYDCSGRCIAIPSQQKAPENIRLRAFPVVERMPFIWIWPGDPSLADPASIPEQEFRNDPAWTSVSGYLKITGSYVHLHENLLDLTHLSFVHDKTFGTPEYARAPMEVSVDDGRIEVWRNVECTLPPMFAKPLSWEGDKAMRRSGGRFVSPAMVVNQAKLTNLSAPEKMHSLQPRVYVESLITPETNASTNYYFNINRNFALADEEVGNFLLESTRAAFSEDVVVLERIHNMWETDQTPGFYEIDVAADKPGVAVRRHLKKLVDCEQGLTSD